MARAEPWRAVGTARRRASTRCAWSRHSSRTRGRTAPWWCRTRCCGSSRRGDRVTGVRGREFYAAPEVVIAAGAWSGAIGGMPRPLSVQPVRGQMAALPWPTRRSARHHVQPRLLPGVPRRRGVDRVDHGVRRVRSLHHARGHRAHPHGGRPPCIPSLRRSRCRRTWAGLRPISPDGRPIVGAEPRLPGLWYATGHGRNGILLAGITGVIIRELLDGEDPREEMDALRADRFWRW